MEVRTYGKKSDLLRLARRKINNDPGKYVDHIYGEHEVGGTSWLYLASEPFDTIGFQVPRDLDPVGFHPLRLARSSFKHLWATFLSGR